MRNILLLLLLMIGLGACSDDNEGFVTTQLPDNAFSIKPVSGGAIMHYVLPDDPDIVGIRVRYKDENGKDMLRAASSTCDSVKLVGFNKAADNVSAQVSFCYTDDRESQPFDVTFSTTDSGPVSFIKNVEVLSNWGGFVLRYNNPPETTGIAHLFYLGYDPLTNLPDTILMADFFLQETNGDEETTYMIKQDLDNYTVIIRVEDFRGNIVDQRTWADVEKLEMVKLTLEDFIFYCDNSIEDPIDKLSWQYLFDGDTKGLVCFEGEREKCYSFLAGPDGAGLNAHPMYMDLKQNTMLASTRIYNLIKNEAATNWRPYGDGGLAGLCKLYNENELPCEVTLYGIKDNGKSPASYEDMNNLDGWEELGTFKQDKYLGYDDRWCHYCWNQMSYTPLSEEQLEEEDPEYLEILVPRHIQGDEGFRFLKIVINDVFNSTTASYANADKYVQFHELEVYTNKR